MKKVNLLLIFLMISVLTFGQKEKTPKIEKAKLLLDKVTALAGDPDKKEDAMEALSESKSIIDDAIVHEKTLDKSKTWYYRGLIYEAIYMSEDPDINGLADNAFEESATAFLKVKEMDKEASTYFIFSDQRLNALYGSAFNAAAEAYQNGDYQDAIDHFNQVKMIYPNDTAAYTYSGYAAQQLDDNEVALENFNYLADNNMADVTVHRNIIYIYRSQLNDTTAAINAASRAREKFPEDHDLKQDEITMLILSGQAEAAKEKLLIAIDNDPDDYVLYYEMGYLYDADGDQKGAIEWYDKCLEKNPDYFEALYNRGVNQYNFGAAILKEAQDMDYETYKKEGKGIEAKANEEFKVAIPYFERAHEANPEDISTLQTLQTLYSLMKEYEKVNAVKQKLEALGISE